MIGTDRTGADREGCQDGAVPVVAFKSPFLDSAETTNQDRHGWQQQQEERHETGDNRPRQLPGCVLIILNSRIRVPIGPVFSKLWSMSSYRICADGGANRLFDAAAAAIANTNGGGDATYDISSSLKVSAESPQPSGPASQTVLQQQSVQRSSSSDAGTGTPAWGVEHGDAPDLIIGDLDSLRDDVETYYRSKNVQIERVADQDTNDLDKALRFLERTRPEVPERVFVYGAFGGRFDQEMASIQALFRWKDSFGHRLWLYDEENCAFLLGENIDNEIFLPNYGENHESCVGEGPTCGLIPIGMPCESVITDGLKWDLDGSMPLRFGGLISSSNRVMKERVRIRCSQPLIFTTEVEDVTAE